MKKTFFFFFFFFRGKGYNNDDYYYCIYISVHYNNIITTVGNFSKDCDDKNNKNQLKNKKEQN